MPINNIPQIHVSWDEIQEPSSMWPCCIAQVSIDDIDWVISQNSGKAMLVVTLTGIDPPAIAGSSRVERFVVGTDDDRAAADTSTWAKQNAPYGVKRFKKFLSKAAVPFNMNDLQRTCAQAINAQLLVEIHHKEDTQEGEWKGRIRDEIKGASFFRIADREPTVIDCTCKVCRGEPLTPPTSAPITPAITAALNAKAPAPPTAPAAPTPPTTPLAPPINLKTPPAPGTVPCGLCGVNVPAADFGTHMVQCTQTHMQNAAFIEEV